MEPYISKHLPQMFLPSEQPKTTFCHFLLMLHWPSKPVSLASHSSPGRSLGEILMFQDVPSSMLKMLENNLVALHILKHANQ